LEEKRRVAKKIKSLGFLPNTLENQEIKKTKKQPTGRLISWSPWPPASFKNNYPAFPLVTTVLIIIFLSWITKAL
tara:strand:+ start:186 stop:410 length:225 start_codon:yes stop_codon:yes gene_type:complete